MRLHIGEAAAEQFCHPLDRQPLGHIDELAAAVIAPPRQPFGIFVGQHGALRLEHGAADDILRGDQLDVVALAAEFQPDGVGDFRIGVGQRFGKEALIHGFCALGNRHSSLLKPAKPTTA